MSLPAFVNKLLLMIDSGLTLQDAFKRIADSYRKIESGNRNSFMNKIIQNLIDNNTNNQISLSSYVGQEIDKTLEGYDLSIVERSYINNLIDNEINGESVPSTLVGFGKN